LVANTIAGHTAQQTSPIALKNVSCCAFCTEIDIIAARAVRKGAIEASSLIAACGICRIVKKVIGNAASADISHVTTGTVLNVAGGALTNTAGK
jgi:predicted PP-loop superfamily ATPase